MPTLAVKHNLNNEGTTISFKGLSDRLSAEQARLQAALAGDSGTAPA